MPQKGKKLGSKKGKAGRNVGTQTRVNRMQLVYVPEDIYSVVSHDPPDINALYGASYIHREMCR